MGFIVPECIYLRSIYEDSIWSSVIEKVFQNLEEKGYGDIPEFIKYSEAEDLEITYQESYREGTDFIDILVEIKYMSFALEMEDDNFIETSFPPELKWHLEGVISSE
ncbi:hypothetical protein [[Acholeplasma] multilocale]|uniref:hypothetical protein n=1 Tax=[Acholeplasma] multilocale TaxID=264638 RepID=UPI00047A2ED9|nr:hypothetical protein [[Acholeplasma] multilocale]